MDGRSFDTTDLEYFKKRILESLQMTLPADNPIIYTPFIPTVKNLTTTKASIPNIKVVKPLPYPFVAVKNVEQKNMVKGEFYLISKTGIIETLAGYNVNAPAIFKCNVYGFGERFNNTLTLINENTNWHIGLCNPLLLKRDFSTTHLINYKKVTLTIIGVIAITLGLSLLNKEIN